MLVPQAAGSWALIRIHALLTLLCVLSCCHDVTDESNNNSCLKEDPFFTMNTCSAKSTACTDCSPNNGTSREEYIRPVCEEGKGCDPPLRCSDFETCLNQSEPLSTAVKVSPQELEGIMEKSGVLNCCSIVMFYAPWCEHSTAFARRFNALGRTFSDLPAYAVDLGEHDPYKYIMAYLPVVSLYYKGRPVYRLELGASYEELARTVENMTGLPPRNSAVLIEDAENDGPVETERVNTDGVYLYLSACWIVFVLLVHLIRFHFIQSCLSVLKARLRRAILGGAD